MSIIELKNSLRATMTDMLKDLDDDKYICEASRFCDICLDCETIIDKINSCEDIDWDEDCEE